MTDCVRNSEESELVHFSERLRSTNRALHCAFRGHFVSDLLAMRLHSISANVTRLRLSLFVISPQGFMLQSNTVINHGKSPIPHKKYRTNVRYFFGGDKGIRTPGLLNAIQTRYQLRHAPVVVFRSMFRLRQ